MNTREKEDERHEKHNVLGQNLFFNNTTCFEDKGGTP